MFGASWLFESAPPKGRRPKLGFGNSFVCVGLLVRLPSSERTICLPVLFRLWRATAGGPTKVDFAHELIEMLAARFPKRRIELVADSYYPTRKLATLPANVITCVRLRSNSAFWAAPPVPSRRYRGRPRKRGERLGSIRELVASPDTRWVPLRLVRDGQEHLSEVHAFDGVWFKVLNDQNVRVVIARDPQRHDRPVLAVLCTDHSLAPVEILSRYADRWAIETAFALVRKHGAPIRSSLSPLPGKRRYEERFEMYMPRFEADRAEGRLRATHVPLRESLRVGLDMCTAAWP